MCVRIPELFRKAKINEIYDTSLLSDTHGNVVGFEVAMKEITRVYVLKTTKLAMLYIKCDTT